LRTGPKLFRYRPKLFVQPTTTEAEIIYLVKNSKPLRVFGSAHSFLADVEGNLERLLKENDHFSLCLFPFSKCASRRPVK
jgi:hypothetical protein